MIRWELKLTITELHIIFVFILCLHGGLMAYKSQHGEQMAAIKEEQQKKKVAADKRTEEEEAELGILGKKRRKPFVITYLGNLKQKRHSELLALLQGKFNKGPVKISSTEQVVTVQKGGVVEVSTWEESNFEITEEQKKNLIKRLIKGKMVGVDVCKRKHLLEDEFLMGTLKVNMKIQERQNLTVPRFKGHGNRKVIESLENCVKTELASMRFPRDLVNQEVAFDLKMN